MENTAQGGLGKRLLAWVVLIVVAVFALKVIFGVVIGLFQALLSIALLVLLVFAVVWAIRRI
jgi:hypothetical protein